MALVLTVGLGHWHWQTDSHATAPLMAVLAADTTATVAPLSGVALPVTSSPFLSQLPGAIYFGSSSSGGPPTSAAAQLSLTYFAGPINLTWPENEYVTCTPRVLVFTADSLQVNFTLTATSLPSSTLQTFNLAATGNVSAYSEMTNAWVTLDLSIVASSLVDSCSGGESSDGYLQLSSSVSSVVSFANNESASNFLDLASSKRSFCAWVRRAHNSSTLAHPQGIFSIGDGSGDQFGAYFDTTDSLHIILGSTIAGIGSHTTTGVWEHYCATVNEERSVFFYRDGSYVTVISYGGTWGSTTGAVTVGSFQPSTNPTNLAAYLMQDGAIDELRVWRRLLTTIEIATGYTSGSWEDYALALYYPFATPLSTTSTTVTDESGFHRDGNTTAGWSTSATSAAKANLTSVCLPAILTTSGLPPTVLAGEAITLRITPSQAVQANITITAAVYNAATASSVAPYLWFTIGSEPTQSVAFSAPASGDVLIAFVLSGVGTYSWQAPTQISSVVSPIAGLCASDNGHLATQSAGPGSLGLYQNLSIDLSPTADFSGHDVTLSVWFRTWTADLANYHSALFLGGNGYSSYMVITLTSELQPRFGMPGNGLVGDTALSTGAWHLVTAVYQTSSGGTTGQRLLYVDGVPVASDTPPTETRMGATVTVGSRCVTLMDCIYYWEGDLDEARIFSRALAASEVATLWRHNFVSSASLEVYYPFSEQRGSIAGDHSGLAARVPDLPSRNLSIGAFSDTGSNTAVAWLWESAGPLCSATIVNCPYGYADDGHLVLNGTAAFPLTRVGFPAALNTSSSQSTDFTITLWLLRSQLTTVGQTVLQWGSTTSLARFVAVQLSSQNVVRFSAGNYILLGPADASIGVWQQYTFTARTAANGGTRRILRNGITVAEDALFGEWSLDQASPLLVGGTPTTPFYGHIDELMVFNSALTAAQVADAFAQKSFRVYLSSCVMWYPFYSLDGSVTADGAVLYADLMQVSGSGSDTWLLSQAGYAAPVTSSRPICLGATLTVDSNLTVVDSTGAVSVVNASATATSTPLLQPGSTVSLQLHLDRATAAIGGVNVTCELSDRLTSSVLQTGSAFFSNGSGGLPITLDTTAVNPFFDFTAADKAGWVKSITFTAPSTGNTSCVLACTQTSGSLYVVPTVRLSFATSTVPIYFFPTALAGLATAPTPIVLALAQLCSFSWRVPVFVGTDTLTGKMVGTYSAYSSAITSAIGTTTLGTTFQVAPINETITFTFSGASSAGYSVVTSGLYRASYAVESRRMALCDTNDGHIVFSPGLVTAFPATSADNLPSVSTGVTNGSVSITLWIRADYYPSTSEAERNLCAFALGSGTGDGESLSFCLVVPYLNRRLTSGGSLAALSTPGSSAVTPTTFGEWLTVAVVIETTNTNTTRTMYRRGTQSLSDASSSYAYSGDGVLLLGGAVGGSSAWVGGIDEFRLYNRALTAAEIFLAHQPDSWSTSGLQMYLPFSDQTGTTITDWSGVGANFNFTANVLSWERSSPLCAQTEAIINSYHAGSTSQPWWYQDCGTGLQDDGSHFLGGSDGVFGTYANPPVSAGGFLLNDRNFTVSIWMRRVNLTTTGAYAWSFGRIDNAALTFGIDATRNIPLVLLGTDLMERAVSSRPNAWERYTLTWTILGSTVRMTLYRNGELLMQTTPTASLALDVSSTQGPRLTIGGAVTSAGVLTSPLNGYIDDFKLYLDWAASASEIASSFSSGIWSYGSNLALAYGFYDGPSNSPTLTVTDDSGNNRTLIYPTAVTRYTAAYPVCLPAYAVMTNVPKFIYVGSSSSSVSVHFTQQVSRGHMDILVGVAYNSSATMTALPLAVFTPNRTTVSASVVPVLQPLAPQAVVLPQYWAPGTLNITMTTPSTGTDFGHYTNLGAQTTVVPIVHELTRVEFFCRQTKVYDFSLTDVLPIDVPLNTPLADPTQFRTNYTISNPYSQLTVYTLILTSYVSSSVFTITTGSIRSPLSTGGTLTFSEGTLDSTGTVTVASTTLPAVKRYFTIVGVDDITSVTLQTSTTSTMSSPSAATLSPSFVSGTRNYSASVVNTATYLSIQVTHVAAVSLNLTRLAPGSTSAVVVQTNTTTTSTGLSLTSATLPLSVGLNQLTILSLFNAPLTVNVTRAAAASSTLTTSPTLTTTVSSSVNPCDTESPCENGGTCSYTTTSSASASDTVNVTFSCACASGTFGPTCSFVVLGCVSCTTNYSGGTTARLIGAGFGYVTSLDVHESEGVWSAANLTLAQAASDSSIARVLSTASISLTASQGVGVLTFQTPSLTDYLNATLNAETTEAVDNSLAVIASHTHSMTEFASSTLAAQYEPLSVHLQFTTADGVTQIITINYTSLIYYSPSSCLLEGEYQPDGLGGCTACPTGAYCPGGGRAWPTSGYWSTNEYATPVKCSYSAACPGSLSTTSSSADSIVHDTQICAAAYSGTACATCASGYYMLSQRCYACGGTSSDQMAQLVGVIIAAGVIMGILAIGIAFLQAYQLAVAVSVLVLAQKIVTVGTTASADLPVGAETASYVFSLLSIINFDIEVIRPGCSTLPSLTFVQIFWITIAMVAITALLFLLACLARLVWLRRRRRWERQVAAMKTEVQSVSSADLDLSAVDLSSLSDEQFDCALHISPYVDFRMRVKHAVFILLTLFYLKLTTMQLEMFQCSYAPDPQSVYNADPDPPYSSYLTQDLTTRCYAEGHLATIIIVILLFVFYTFGFPLACYVLLVRSFADEHSTGLSGFLWRRYPRIFRDDTRGRVIKLSAVEMHAIKKAAMVDDAADDQLTSNPARQTSPTVTTSESPATFKDSSSPSSSSILLPSDPSHPSHGDYVNFCRVATFGYLFMGLKSEFFPHRVELFIVSFWFAVVDCFETQTNINLFLLGLAYAAQCLLVCWYWPFMRGIDNMRFAALGAVSLVHATIMIAVQSDGTRDGFFIALIIIFFIVCTAVGFRKRIFAVLAARFCPKRLAAQQRYDDEEEAAEAEEQAEVRPHAQTGSNAPVDSHEVEVDLSRWEPQDRRTPTSTPHPPPEWGDSCHLRGEPPAAYEVDGGTILPAQREWPIQAQPDRRESDWRQSRFFSVPLPPAPVEAQEAPSPAQSESTTSPD